MDNKIMSLLNNMDDVTKYHCIRTSALIEEILNDKNYNVDGELLRKSALLHDVGKIFIPSFIIDKDSKINEFEREIIDFHAYYGYRYLLENNIDEKICLIVLFHHGKKSFNGFTYMDKFTADEKILYSAEILRTVDAYDALTSDRPYRGKYNHDGAIYILKENNFHPETINSLENINNNKMNEIWFKEKEDAIINRWINKSDEEILEFLGFEKVNYLKSALLSTKLRLQRNA